MWRLANIPAEAHVDRPIVEAAKASLGFIPDRPFLYEKLTAGEFLRFHAGLYGMHGNGTGERIHELLLLFELLRWENELIEAFSHGMKQRLVMCAAFLHRHRLAQAMKPPRQRNDHMEGRTAGARLQAPIVIALRLRASQS